MICPKCGINLNDNVKFCKECGYAFGVNRNVCKVCGTAVEDDVKFCPECGNRIKYKSNTQHLNSYSQPSNNYNQSSSNHSQSSNSYNQSSNSYNQSSSNHSQPSDNQQSDSQVYKQPKPWLSQINTDTDDMVKLIVVVAIIGVLLAMIVPSISSLDSDSPTISNQISEVEETSFTIEKGSSYSFMNDEKNVYIATAISDTMIKIENWDKFIASSKTSSYNYDVCTLDINDPDVEFYWLDNDHTAFSIMFSDKDNSKCRYEKEVSFTLNLDSSDTNKGTNSYTDVMRYIYVSDDLHVYNAIPLSKSLIKIECWKRLFATELSSYVYNHDVMIVNLVNSNTDFNWVDDSHTSFTLTFDDDLNEDFGTEKFVSFNLVSEDYKYANNVALIQSGIMKEQYDGFNSETNNVTKYCGFTIETPNYWQSYNSDDGKPTWIVTSDGKVIAALVTTRIHAKDDATNFTEDAFIDAKDAIISEVQGDVLTEVNTCDVIDTGEIKGFDITGISKLDDGTVTSGHCFCFISEKARDMYFVAFLQSEDSPYAFDNDFTKIINSIKLTDSVEEETSASLETEAT